MKKNAIVFYGDYNDDYKKVELDGDIFFYFWDNPEDISMKNHIKKITINQASKKFFNKEDKTKSITFVNSCNRDRNRFDEEYLLTIIFNDLSDEYDNISAIKMGYSFDNACLEQSEKTVFFSKEDPYRYVSSSKNILSVISSEKERFLKITQNFSLDQKKIKDHVSGSNFCLLISRYKENIDWIKNVSKENNNIDKIVVIDKNNNKLNFCDNKVINVNTYNKGRESSGYIDFIIECYDDLPNFTCFSQADPFDHSPDFIELIKEKQFKLYDDKFQSLSCRYDSIIPIKYPEIYGSQFINGKKSHLYTVDTNSLDIIGVDSYLDNVVDLSVSVQKKLNSMDGKYFDYFFKRIHLEKPKKYVHFVYGAIFCLHKSSILRHEKDFYINLKEFIDEEFYSPWLLEIFWHYIFTGLSFTTCPVDM